MAVIRSTETVAGHELEVLIEVDEPAAGGLGDVYGETRDAKKVVENAVGVFRGGLDLAGSLARQAVEGIGRIADEQRPDEFQVQVAIKLDTELGAFLVKSSAEAQLQVTMTWRRSVAG